MKFVTKRGLWVNDSFTSRFGSSNVIPAKTVLPFVKLGRDMYDTEIKKEFGVQECALEDVAAFLENPPEGTKDGYWNIFYVAGCVVSVNWDADYEEWHVLAWGLDGHYWSAGNRAFGCNSLSEAQPNSSDTLSLGPLDAAIAQVKEAGYTVVKIV